MSRAPAPAAALAPLSFALEPAILDAETREAIEELNSLQFAAVESAEDATEAAELLREIVRKKDVFSAMLNGLIKPVEQRVKDFKALFKPGLEARAASEAKVKALLGAFQLKQEAERRRLLAEATKAAQERKPAALSTALIAAQAVSPGKLEGVAVRSIWTAEIFNPAIVPCEWRVPDEKRINAHARNTPADREPEPVPGVRFVLDAQVSARR